MAIKLNKLVYIYSVDSSAFYNENEQKIHRKLLKSYYFRDYLKTLSIECAKHKKYINHRINKLKSKLQTTFDDCNEIRHLRKDALKEKNVISMFDSVLTRTLKMKHDELSDDILVVQTYYFQILKDIIKNGFVHNGEKYIYLTSSAGQIRTKKSVFIKASIWNKQRDTFMCGLSIEEINKRGGVNINKFQAYLALSNSATDEWKNFDINRSIVVDDLETNVHSLVDYIDHKSYEITRRTMDIPIEHTDGCGLILPRKSKKSFMVRLPWVKGLLVPFPFDKFAEEHQSFIVKDIYGKDWDIVKDRVEIIFTRSQFKMWKYYDDWLDYKRKFIKYQCQAARLNEEDVSGDVKLNYQMIQTLSDMSIGELETISKDTVGDILKIGSDKETMLRVLGATEHNHNKNHFQQALLLYPELLNDPHSKQVIKDKKKSLVKDARSGKLNIKGHYTFIIPDLYAFCEKLFLGIKEPKGLLKDNEVFCDLYEHGKVDILRSPHLYREHGIRTNVMDEKKRKWFITRGIYTSIFDPISKILQFDVDGDKALVIQDTVIVNVAERNMQGIVPLYYEMAKAPAEQVNSNDIFKSLILAYKANIGEISNNITKIWNSEHINLDVIKWLCMENNFVIDYAKTLYMPTRPEFANKTISQYIKVKVPYFFINAKDKELKNVESLNNSVVNRLETVILNKRINFMKVAGHFDYKMLMSRQRVKLDQTIIDTYIHLDRSKKKLMKQYDDSKGNGKLFVYKIIREELLELNNDISYVTDVLIKYLYSKKQSSHKKTLWECFGDMMVKNLIQNLDNMKQCHDCGERFHQVKQRQILCENCQNKRNRYFARKRKQKQRICHAEFHL